MLEIMMIVFFLVFAAFFAAIYQVIGEVVEDLQKTIDHGRKASSSLDRFYEEIAERRQR